MSVDDISQLLRAWSDGNQLALGELTPVVFVHELRRLACRYMRGERDNHSLQTTVRRGWSSAKIWLDRELTGETDDGLGSLETAR